MPQDISIEAQVQILVEGNDDRNFFRAFANHCRIDGFQIQSFGGAPGLGRFLRTFAGRPGFDSVTALAIVRDADDNAASAFRSVRSALARAGLPEPAQPGELAAGPPAVAVWIMPDGASPGMLETLLWRSVADDPAAPCVAEFLDCADRAGAPTAGSDEARADKARAHAFVATRPRPEVSVGVAALEGYWDFDRPDFGGLRAFLETVAGPED